MAAASILLLAFLLVFPAPSHAAEALGAARRGRLGLALSGGGARGFAHIGALRVLRENGIVPDFIAGTSMGSIVGGLYALGYSPDELEELIGRIDWQDIFKDDPDRRSLFFEQKRRSSRYVFDFVVRGFDVVLPSSISRGDKITNFFTVATLGAPKSFDSFPIPFRAVATDIVDGTEVILDGSRLTLAEAMRASMAIPGAIEPVDLDDQLLVDGMLVKNLPVDTVIGMGAERVIAIDISNPLKKKEDLDSIFAVADQAFSLQVVKSTMQQRELADIVVVPDLGDLTAADFERGAELIALGEQAVRQRIGEIRKLAGVAIGGTAVPLRRSPRTAPEQRLRIDAIELTGDADTRDLALLHSIGIEPGDRLTSTELDEKIRNIFGGDFLDTVRVAAVAKPDGGHVLRLHVDKRQSNTVGVGIHYDDLYDIVGLANLSVNGLSGPRSVLSADVLVGGVLGGEISYLQYHLFDSAFFVKPRVFVRDQEQDVFRGKRRLGSLRDRYWGAELGAGTSLRNVGQVTGGYRWKRVDFAERGTRFGVDGADDNVGSVFLHTDLDTLDAFPFPTEGSRLQLGIEVADAAWGADRDFWRATLRAAQHVRPADRHTLSAEVRVQSALGSRLPSYEEILFGGPGSFLGFDRQERRGSESAVVTLSYRYRLFNLPLGLGRGAYGTLAYNAGNVWADLDALEDDFEIEHGGAIGLGLDTMFLPVEIAVGFGSDERIEAYFTLGFPLGRTLE